MALVIADRVEETTTTTGTGALTLAGAVTDFRSFGSVLSNGDTTFYTIVDTTNNDWEVGLGTYATSGTALTRTTVYASTNAGAAVNLSSGEKEVFITYPADQAVYEDASSVVTVTNLVVNGSVEEQTYNLTGTAIDPANGTIQYKTLSANTTFTESLADGEYVTLMIDDGTGYTVTWPTMYWPNGIAPTLATTGYNVIQLWKLGSNLYGSYVSA